ncbi:phage head spike fiber domain-containing protein [Aeromonas caviae]|uniref:phage head spike fiber domain-containing protein n=1 Tax=Aeromonas caviae TaxID=648 RepID=UPI00224DFC39|nr:hypothetical protein [Aeromonas caviae]MCX4033905.1 hypothetical protein [Aeromonas caviae]
MAGLWYRAGTIAVTNGSKKVVGTGTTWKSGVSKPDKGHLVWGPDGKPYELDYVESDTVLYLVTAYSGVTASGMAYSIDITRTGAIPAFSRELSALVAYHQLQMDGWQQLLTGTGDVTLTAPDGSKLTVPTWDKVMNAGSGVVAQAKTEADRAKTEAANSAASAASAGNAVVAAALPLPDVWAPLSDSLRLITGYGREVKVGDDVVARMVNFSRSTTATYIGKDGVLKSAAANEPRFEKEGLLIEGQSTNLWSSQTAVDSVNASLASTSLPDGTTGNIYKITPTSGAFAYVRKNFAAQSGNHTLSCYAKLDDGSMAMPSIYCGFNGGLSTKFTGVYVGNGWWRMQAALLAPLGNIGFGYSSVATETTPVWVCNFQLEALPFASSYIPTNGAAVTRTADVVTIPWAGNMPTSDLTVALNYDLIGLGTLSTTQRLIEYGATVGPRFLFQIWGGTGLFESYAKADGLRVASPSIAYGSVAVASTTPTRHALKLTGKALESYATAGPVGATANITIGGTGVTTMYGHIRNLRIWHRALSDDQLKAVA